MSEPAAADGLVAPDNVILLPGAAPAPAEEATAAAEVPDPAPASPAEPEVPALTPADVPEATSTPVEATPTAPPAAPPEPTQAIAGTCDVAALLAARAGLDVALTPDGKSYQARCGRCGEWVADREIIPCGAFAVADCGILAPLVIEVA